MSRFIKVKYIDYSTQSEGNDLWLNLDNVIAVDEHTRAVYLTNDASLENVFIITKDTFSTLIEALKQGKGV
jgi:hypothetical protein